MKKAIKYTLVSVLCITAIAVVGVSHYFSRQERRELLCSGLKVEITDWNKLKFVTTADVKAYLEEAYGSLTGTRTDDIALGKMETLLKGKSAIENCEAYITDDGILHVQIWQREPAVRFQSGGTGFYCDHKGYIFPLQANYTSAVPIVDGHLPFLPGAGYKGEANSERGRKWIADVIDMVDYIKADRTWSEMIVQIHVNDKGCIELIPRTGKEKFIFGAPDDFDEKFSRIEHYYRNVLPSTAAEKSYTRVDVRYKGQVICK